MKSLFAKILKKLQDDKSEISGVISAILSFIVIIAVIMGEFQKRQYYQLNDELAQKTYTELLLRNEKNSLKISVLDIKIKNLNQLLNTVPKNEESRRILARVVREYIDVRLALDSIDNRFKRIEKIIIQNPEKALAIPFLRKDLDNIREDTQSDIDKIKQDVERTNTLILGSIVTLAIALLAQVLSNIFRK